MELIDRYLQAVAGYLPKEQSTDIIAELKDSLLSQIEERESGLGRALTDDEQSALLKQRGHPMLVASSYLPQQQLIGPSVYPYWWFGLRLVLIIVGVIHVILGGIAAVTSGNPVQAIIHAFFEFAGTALVYAGVITLVFALFERYQVRIGLFDNWQPKKLAPTKDLLKIKRGDSLFELVVGVLFIGWWTGLLPFPAVVFHDGVALPFKLSAAWQPFWWGILILVSVDAVMAAVNLIKPYWSGDRLLLRILCNVISIMIVYTMFQQDVLIVLNESVAEPTMSMVKIVTMMNQAVHGTLIVIALINLGELIYDVRRLLQLR